MTTVSGTFSGNGTSRVLRIRGTPETVTISVASGFTGEVYLERSITAGESAWETAKGPFSGAAGFSGVYHAKPLERLRLRAKGFSGSSAYSMADGDAIIHERRDSQNEVVMELRESGDRIYRDLWVDGTLYVGGVAFSAEAGSETVAGVLELATNAETITGTDNTRATHPAGVAAALAAYVPAASESAAGKVELATNAETITGTDNTRATHPAGVAAAIAAAVGSGSSWVVRTTTDTAADGEYLLADMTTAWTLTMPPTPSAGNSFELMTHGPSLLTIARNGSKMAGQTDDIYVLGGENAHLRFVYKDSTTGWTWSFAP